jgi:fatty acid desaturase
VTDQLSALAAGTPHAQAPLGPREQMQQRMPGWLQQPLTVFTGKALSGQRALPWWRPTYHFAVAVVSLIGGVAVSSLGWAAGGWFLFLLAPGWVITAHGLRNLRMMIFHQCSHRNMYRRQRLDAVIGELLASLLVVQNFQRYRREHVAEHHAARHMSLRDPTVQAFLLTLDIHPGMPVPAMRRRVFGKLASPVFHLRFAVARAMSFWAGASRREQVAGAVLYGGGIAAATATGHLPQLLVVWFVPLIPLFQCSNVLRLCVKHTFPEPGLTERRGRAYFGSLTSAVFIGEAAPAPAASRLASILCWARWGLRMLFVHAPVRYLIITADTPVHDFHHRYPSAGNWAHHLYARQADSDAGSPGWGPYTEFWGLGPAMNCVLASLSAADPDYYDARRIRDVSKRETFSAFDD